ncbi:hypothetical protein KKA86_08510 [bacterium]|nr:hypothetical protein [bacterium]MBU4603120.1 hypothetical protein [bacterium]
MKRIIKKYFMNEKFMIRFISLLTVGIILFTLVWFLSYYFLPEGFLKGKAVSDRIVGTEASNTLLAEWGKIAGYNLGVICLITTCGYKQVKSSSAVGLKKFKNGGDML